MKTIEISNSAAKSSFIKDISEKDDVKISTPKDSPSKDETKKSDTKEDSCFDSIMVNHKPEMWVAVLKYIKDSNDKKVNVTFEMLNKAGAGLFFDKNHNSTLLSNLSKEGFVYIKDDTVKDDTDPCKTHIHYDQIWSLTDKGIQALKKALNSLKRAGIPESSICIENAYCQYSTKDNIKKSKPSKEDIKKNCATSFKETGSFDTYVIKDNKPRLWIKVLNYIKELNKENVDVTFNIMNQIGLEQFTTKEDYSSLLNDLSSAGFISTNNDNLIYITEAGKYTLEKAFKEFKAAGIPESDADIGFFSCRCARQFLKKDVSKEDSTKEQEEKNASYGDNEVEKALKVLLDKGFNVTLSK